MFAYCGNNPVLYVDLSGCKLEIASDQKNHFLRIAETAFIYYLLSVLTDDSICLNGTTISISKRANSGLHPVGTDLIRRIIDNENTVTVTISKTSIRTNTSGLSIDKSSQTVKQNRPNISNSGKDCTIKLVSSDFHSKKTGFAPNYVILGHELIHSYHIITGTVISAEEEQTIGFGPYQQNYFTEDKIRDEHGVGPRYRGEIEK